MKRIVVAALGLALTGAAAKDAAPLDPGPKPTWEQAKALAETAIRANLIDPASAQIDWPYRFIGGTLRPILSKTRAGYYTCGFVNAKNRMGGYSGRSWFIVMVNSGAVTLFDISSEDQIGVASATCPGLVSKGLLLAAPPADALTPGVSASVSPEVLQAAASASATTAASKGGLGVSFMPSPYGAMLMAVAPGSAAEKAGLKPGEVIEAINGVPLKGLPADAMIKVVQGPTGNVTLSVIGVGEVKVVRAAG